MKTAKFYLAAAIVAATVMMTSCGNDDEAVNNGSERVEVKFSSAQADVETRVSGTTWDGTEHIGIYMLQDVYSLAAANISEGVSNREYKTASTGATASFTPAGDIIYYPASQGATLVKVKFIAYYPYEAVADGTTTFTRAIDVSDQDNQSAIDFLYAPVAAEYDKTSSTVVLPFAHKLVKLEFNITNDVSVTTPLADGLTVTIDGQATTGTLNLVNGSVATTNAGETITALTATDGATSEAIVFAGTKAGKLFAFTNSAGETFTAPIPDDWQSGNKYTYTVTLKKNAAVITGTITDWGTGNTNPSIDAE
jgi:hypothetical protein